ncbi:MAG: cysteine desulfurase family protein [Gammaproteobacteria bacterium]
MSGGSENNYLDSSYLDNVYLDNNATTPIDERVLEAMLPYLKGRYANASSGHRLGREVRAAMDVAREQVAELVNAHPSQVVFTSGGTEANNMAMKGVAARCSPGLIALSAVEHSSVNETAEAMKKNGWLMAEIAVDHAGRIKEASLSVVADQAPKIIAVMMANNETGVVQNIAQVADVAQTCGAYFFTDAVQAAGKIPLDFSASGAHLMSLSAHKIYGPKGAGALIVDKAVDMEPLLHGGGHEKGRRAGTENVAAIVGFGKASELAANDLAERQKHMRECQAYLEEQLILELPQLKFFGQQAVRLPNTTFFAIPGLDGETLLMALDQAGLAVSSGSACGTGDVEPSHVLLAMGVDREIARSAVRVSTGKDTSHDELNHFVKCLKKQVQVLQSFGAVA